MVLFATKIKEIKEVFVKKPEISKPNYTRASYAYKPVSTSPMVKILETSPTLPDVGNLVDGKVINRDKTALFIDLPPFGTGIIYGREFMNARDIIKKIHEGDTITAKIVERENDDGYVELSLKEARQAIIWSEAEEAINNKTVFDGNVEPKTDIDVDLGTGDTRWKDIYPATLRSGLTAADTLLLQARDVDGAAWTTFATLTSADTPTMSLASAVTAITQSGSDNSTKLATTAYVDAAGGSGDVTGDTASIDKEFVRFNSTTGKIIESPRTDLSTTTASFSDNVDVTFYDDVNDGSPIWSYGSSATNRLTIIPCYNTGAKTI